jgi:hypothetical protein
LIVDNPLVTIARFRDLPEALLAKGKLESSGIVSFLADAELVRADWLYSNAIGNMRLQVSPADAEEALAVLQEPPPESFSAEETGEAYEQPHCPRCHSLDIGFETLDRFWTFAVWLVAHFPIPFRKKNWKCYACGAEWIEEEAETAAPPPP